MNENYSKAELLPRAPCIIAASCVHQVEHENASMTIIQEPPMQ